MTDDNTFTTGIEEEYLLVDLDSGDLVDSAPDGLIEACDRAFPQQVHPELLQCQIEIGTRPRTRMGDLYRDLADLRSIVAETATGRLWAFPLAVVRSGFRVTYGWGFLLDRNFGNDVFGAPPSNVGNR